MITRRQRSDLLFVLLLAAGALLVHGYHLGTEDQAIYLPAIKKMIDPGLYPHDSGFFLPQARPTLFDELMALSVRWTHLSVETVLFGWHVLSIFLFLLACRQLSVRLFRDPVAQWAGVTLVAAVITLPVAGTLVTLTAEYTHPRNLATAALLFALAATLDRKVTALLWLLACAVFHPQMAVFGAFHLAFQAWRVPLPQKMALVPLLAGSSAWREALATRPHHFPLRWKWYEQLGAIAPLLLLAWFARIGRRSGEERLAHVTGRLAFSGTLSITGAVAITVLPGFEPLVPAQSMRSLHLVYILLFLVGGGLLGQYVLRTRLRWTLLFVPVAAVMCWNQMRLYPASTHIEWPGVAPRNEWLEAFDWIHRNTPRDALFALDPRYMERPGEDFHGFRGLAERSMLADYTKDRGVAALFPEVAPAWLEHVRVREAWHKFTADDFRQLRARYGVDWVVVEQPGVAGLPCPYSNARVQVCRVE